MLTLRRRGARESFDKAISRSDSSRAVEVRIAIMRCGVAVMGPKTEGEA